MARLSRRGLLLAGVATGAGLLLYLQPALRPGPLRARLLQVVGGTATLRAPEATGDLDAERVARLWRLFLRIAERWELSANVNLDRRDFDAILAAKTRQVPSYLGEYRAAVELLDELGPGWETDDGELDQLFHVPLSLVGFHRTRLGRLQRYVVGEFMALQIAFGGFRAFGYRNYRGFAGGALTSREVPPYRPA